MRTFFLFSLFSAAAFFGATSRLTRAYAGQPYDIQTLANRVVDLSDQIAGVLISIAFLGFLYGGVKMILASNTGDNKGEGKSVMVMGLIGMFIIVTLWGILRVAQNTFLIYE